MRNVVPGCVEAPVHLQLIGETVYEHHTQTVTFFQFKILGDANTIITNLQLVFIFYGTYADGSFLSSGKAYFRLLLPFH